MVQRQSSKRFARGERDGAQKNQRSESEEYKGDEIVGENGHKWGRGESHSDNKKKKNTENLWKTKRELRLRQRPHGE